MSTLGRNDECHCGSGKKYKKCHLDKDQIADSKEREKAALNAASVAAAAETDTPEKNNATPKKSWLQQVKGKFASSKDVNKQTRLPSMNKGG
ncbi:MAG: SEC-C metal-binding domain-containing protein [Elusimicrobiota bacterium]